MTFLVSQGQRCLSPVGSGPGNGRKPCLLSFSFGTWGTACIKQQNFQFERTAREFSQWRAVPKEDRSAAPAWWWQPAIDVVPQHEATEALMCYRLQLPVGSTYAAGAAVLMATLADQTSLPWPDEFPRKIKREKELDPT
jgi:hypothetical protein